MPYYGYQIEVSHDRLGKYRILRGYDPHVLEARARELRTRWDQQYTRQLEAGRRSADRIKRQQHVDDNLEEARQRSEHAQFNREMLERLLADSITLPPFKWSSLVATAEYSVPPPVPPAYKKPPSEPPPIVAKVGVLEKIFPKRARRKQQEAATLNALKKQQWIQVVRNVQAQNDALINSQAEAVKAWEAGRQKHDAECAAQRSAIDQKKLAYEAKESSAVVALSEIVLSRTNHVLLPSPEFEVEYKADSGSLIVEYSLPPPDALSKLKEVRFIKARDELTELFFTEAEQGRFYDSVVYQICLRVLSDLFRADTARAFVAITFNGWVTSIDPAKGKEVTTCIMSVTAPRDQFMDIDLGLVDPKACFKSLKGVGSSKLHGLAAIAPICTINREDSRFIPAHDVADKLSEGFNLATIEWEEFEQLIREVFAKEFSVNGGEVKVTQASRDRGVDAVAFDPDPIRGGKIVIQAKRYTNTVDVSAVRDLYGTVLNEGANKGILVTTADYGPDAYQFAADKPLTLLNGANLLHLLAKHGHTVRIDLQEAKKLATAAAVAHPYILRRPI